MPIRFQVDPDFYDHPKSIGLSDAAVALWTRAGSYCAAKLLDGFVPENVLGALSKTPDAASDELVARRLWRRTKGGYRFHQWTERNLTRARVEADRATDRAKKKRQRAAAKGTLEPLTDDGSSPGTGQLTPAFVPPGFPWDSSGSPSGIPPTVPGLSVSVSVSESVSGSGHAANGGPAPPPRCPDHTHDPNPPPCGRCADARKTRDRWDTTHATLAADRDRNAPRCPTHPTEHATHCRPCASERLGGTA